MYPIDIYKDFIGDKKVILVDFDNTICIDEWPFIGEFVPGAIETLQKLQAFGHKIILFTQRDDLYPISCEDLELYKSINGGNPKDDSFVDILTPAIDICKDAGIEFWDINRNKLWEDITGDFSRKVFADLVIDDHNLGTPVIYELNTSDEYCTIVDWKKVDEWLKENNYYNYNSFILHDFEFRYTQNEYGDMEIGVLDKLNRTYVAYITWTDELGLVYDYVKGKSVEEIHEWLKKNTDFFEGEWKS